MLPIVVILVVNEYSLHITQIVVCTLRNPIWPLFLLSSLSSPSGLVVLTPHVLASYFYDSSCIIRPGDVAPQQVKKLSLKNAQRI